MTIANLSADTATPVEMRLDAVSAKLMEARVLTGDIHAKNEFDTPDAVHPVAFEGVRVEAAAGGTEVTYTLPACSVAVLRFQA